MGNQFADLVTLVQELRDLQTVKSAVPQKINSRTNHKERKELIWPFSCNTKAFTKQTNKHLLNKQINSNETRERKFFEKGLEGFMRAYQSAYLSVRRNGLSQNHEGFARWKRENLGNTTQGGIKIGTLILGSASKWSSQCNKQDGW